jgi:hypothetical protein
MWNVFLDSVQPQMKPILGLEINRPACPLPETSRPEPVSQTMGGEQNVASCLVHD